jgi:hypothetical protein
MRRVIHHAQLPTHHLGHPFARPHVPADPTGFGTTSQEGGEARELLGCQPPWSPGRGAGAEGRRASLPGAAHPLADRPGADAQRLGNLPLGPPLLFEVPGL